MSSGYIKTTNTETWITFTCDYIIQYLSLAAGSQKC